MRLLFLVVACATAMLGCAGFPARAWAESGGTQSYFSGVDACAAPSTTTMNQLWQLDPVYEMGIYVGGVNKACAQANLGAAWINRTLNMTGGSTGAWNVLPIYVGAQAPRPCAPRTYRSHMPTNLAEARQLGLSEANDAVNQSADPQSGLRRLNLMPGNGILYLDIEGFSYLTTVGGIRCADFVSSYVDGFASTLRPMGYRFGLYSSAAGIDMQTYTTPGSILAPDTIWFARSRTSGIGKQTVWGDPAIPDHHMTQRRRIHQHTLNWQLPYAGGLFPSDLNCLNGGTFGHNRDVYNPSYIERPGEDPLFGTEPACRKQF